MKTLTVDDVRNMGGTFVNETLDIAFSIEGKVHNHQWDKKAVADIQLFDGYGYAKVGMNGTENVELYTSLAHLLPKSKEQVTREEILSTLDADVHKAFDQLLEKHVELCKVNKVSFV